MKRIYRFALLGTGVCLFLSGAWTLYHYNVLPEGFRMQCLIFRWSGFYCPGCGATRACYAILHGQWKEAAGYNPLLVILMPFLGLYIVARAIDWAATGKNHIDEHIPDRALYIVLWLSLFYGIARNIPVWPFYLLQP